MPIRAPWEDGYCITQQATAIGTNDSTASGIFATPNIGITGATGHGLVLDEHINISPGVEIVTTEKTTGLSEKRIGGAYEVVVGKKLPTVSIGAMGFTEHKMAVFGWSLFQKGASEGAAALYTKTFIPYTFGNCTAENWIEIGRAIGARTSADGHIITGCICKQITISGAGADRMSMGAELIGRTYRDTYNHSTATASNFTAESVNDLRMFDFTWTIDGTTARIDSFDTTIVNNVSPKYYNEYVPSVYYLGRIGVTGTFKLAMSTTTVGDNIQIDRYVAGTDILLVGTAASRVTISINCHYTGAEIDPAEELLLSLPYEGAYDGTNHAIQITASDSVQRSIP